MTRDPFGDDPLNALVAVYDDAVIRAEQDSSALDATRPLAGVAVAVKDNLDLAGAVTGNGSALFAAGPPAVADAAVVARLRAGGAELVAKTHLTELACGTSGLNPHLGDARNPHNPEHHPGGSSSGSAIAVAAGYVSVAVGSDTSGSIRVPAAACGVVGMKPTFGRVSTTGLSVCCRTLDHVGPIAADVARAADALFVMQAEGWDDPRDATVDPSSLRVGVLTGPFVDTCTADVLANFENSLTALGIVGCELVEVDLGLDLAAVDEGANAFGRDLYRAYGERIDGADPAIVSDELRMWMDLYAQVTEARYQDALVEQLRLTSLVAARQGDVDVLVCPTMRVTPGLLSEAASEPREGRTGNTALFNLTGQPSLTLPNGFGRAGLPTGLLLTGHRGRDDHVLSLARALEVVAPLT